jgi:PPOX class probable F420-dependent enzyme
LDERIVRLARERNVSLTTYRRDGRAVSTPVWFALDGARIIVWTDGASGKVKRLRENGRAGVAPSDARGRTKTAPVDAKGRVLPESENARSRQLLTTKYRLLKPLVDLWTTLGIRLRRKQRPEEVFLEITLQ